METSGITPDHRQAITFRVGTRHFNYRIVGVCVDEGYVLLHRSETDDFWSLPGGRGEILEPSEETVRREFQEELYWQVNVDRLLWLVENFFTYQGVQYHELALYYKLTIESPHELRDKSLPFPGVEDTGTRLIFQWFPIADLASVALYPSFLRDGLKTLPEVTRHVVHWDS